MTQMCAPSDRADALNALTLVENFALLSTQGLFGFLYAALAEMGKPYLTFFCNAVRSSSNNVSRPKGTNSCCLAGHCVRGCECLGILSLPSGGEQSRGGPG